MNATRFPLHPDYSSLSTHHSSLLIHLSRLYDAFVAEGGNLVGREAEFAEHFVGVLAESRGATTQVAGRIGEPHRRRRDGNGAAFIIHFFKQPTRIHLRVA